MKRATSATLYLIVLLPAACDKQIPAPAPSTAPVQVDVVTPQQRDVPIIHRGVGTLRANQVANIAPEVLGVLTTMNFTDGQRVKSGDTLITLDSDIQTAAVAAAEAIFNNAQREFTRLQRIYGEQAASKNEYLQSQYDRDKAKADADQARAILGKHTIRAPFDGVLTIHERNIGDLLNPGDSVITLNQDDPMLVDFGLPSTSLDQLAINQLITIELAEHPGRYWEGKVIAISPVIDQSTRTARLRAQIPNHDHHLHTGRFAKVAQTIGIHKDAVLIPQDAVVLRNNGASVFTVTNNVAKLRPVKLGDYVGFDVIVSEGLSPTETVVVRGWHKLRDGMQVITHPATTQSTGQQSPP